MALSSSQSPDSQVLSSRLTDSPAAIDHQMKATVAARPADALNTDRVDRSSFSSCKENHTTGIAQSFTDSKISSLLRHHPNNDEAIIDDLSSGSRTPEIPGLEDNHRMMTHPQSVLHGSACPCDGFKGWKGITIGGKVASRSYGDLKRLNSMSWDRKVPSKEKAGQEVPAAPEHLEDVEEVEEAKHAAGSSRLEKLPAELRRNIIDQLSSDIPPNSITPRNMDFMALLQTSRAMQSVTLNTLYNYVTIPHSRIFRKFLDRITRERSLGAMVRRLDFSHFNPTGAGMTARQRAETKNLIPETICECLRLTPNLQEFLAQEHIGDDLDSNVIRILLCELPKMVALDLCACSTTTFRDNVLGVIEESPSPLPGTLPMKRLSLHECTILPTEVYTTLLPKLEHLTHLDVSHTRITDEALHSIPVTARLTHLNLSKCSFLTGASVVNFLTNHPAAKSLVYLNLSMDIKSHELFTADELTALLPALPSTLKSLNLKGSQMNSSHVPLLLPLTKHLEELGLGFHFDLGCISSLLFPAANSSVEEQLKWVPHSLRYIDASDLILQQMDLGTMFGMSCPVLKSISEPLEVIEIGSVVAQRVSLTGESSLQRLGWCFKEVGRRGWLVREGGGRGFGDWNVKGMAVTRGEVKENDGEGKKKRDNGARKWKMGAMFWGMRKVPVSVAEVGGMYGHYMFKR